MKFLTKFLAILLLIFSFACSQKPAQVVNRSKNIYNKNNGIKEKYREAAVKNTATATNGNASGSANGNELKNHQIEVGSGDTLYSLSKKYRVTLRDLIKQNNLSPPYNLVQGSRITIPSPRYHEVTSGETIYAISRLYGMKIDNLIEMNDLKEPYSVKVGEKIRIAKFEEDAMPQNVAENKSPQPNARLNAEKKPEAEAGIIEKTLDKFNHFSWPVRGQIVSQFGPKSGGLYNDGVNIKAKEGTEVKSSEDGVVAYVGNELKGYGNLVIVKHSGGWITAYAHLKDAVAKRGQKVAKGQKIGTVGSTGNVNSPQLYFGLRKGRDAVNPQNYLKN